MGAAVELVVVVGRFVVVVVDDGVDEVVVVICLVVVVAGGAKIDYKIEGEAVRTFRYPLLAQDAVDFAIVAREWTVVPHFVPRHEEVLSEEAIVTIAS